MYTSLLATRTRPGTQAALALVAVLVAVALSVWLGSSAFTSPSAFAHRAGPPLIGALVAWMFVSERYTLTLSCVLIYLGLFDGPVKLDTSSNLATLGRDSLLYAITLGAIARMIVRKTPVEIPPLALGVAAWLLICVAQIANPADSSVGHATAAIRQHIEFVPLFFFGYVLLRSEHRLEWLFALLVFVAAINGIVALVQSHLTPAQLASWGPGYQKLMLGLDNTPSRTFVDASGVVRVRPPALGSDFGFGGSLAIVAVPGTLALIANARSAGRLAWVGWVGAPFVVLAIVTSQSRTAVVGSVIAALAYLMLTTTNKRGLAIALVSLVIAGLSIFAVAELFGTGENRYASITPTKVIDTTLSYRQGTLALIPTYAARYPLGAGMGSVGPAGASTVGGASNNNLDAESEFTFLEIELGLPGLFVLLSLTIAGIAIGARLRKLADPPVQRALMALTAVLIALFACWIIGDTSDQSPTSPFFWLATGALGYWYQGMQAGRVAVRRRALRSGFIPAEASNG